MATVLLFVMLPLLSGIALLVMLSDGGPALVRQRRGGVGSSEFGCLKFRTTALDYEDTLQEHLARSSNADAERQAEQQSANDPGVTRLGRLLRESGLDELPQLVNVLKGDMSLIGLRPTVQREAAFRRDSLDRRTKPAAGN
jgi:lipopolysaccharide/colanic/teichoic acid biosynthesis glycosyltransferase